MVSGGVEVLIGVVQEPIFGPLVVFGLGGVATDVLGDHTARLAPLTSTDADQMIREARAATLLFGHRGAAPADVSALADTLLRVSRLADDLPGVAELDLNPIMARPDGASAVDARVRITRRSRKTLSCGGYAEPPKQPDQKPKPRFSGRASPEDLDLASDSARVRTLQSPRGGVSARGSGVRISAVEQEPFLRPRAQGRTKGVAMTATSAGQLARPIADAAGPSARRLLTVLLRRYGIPVAESVTADSADSAVEAAWWLGFPVTMVAEGARLAGRPETTRCGLATPAQVRVAYRRLAAARSGLR